MSCGEFRRVDVDTTYLAVIALVASVPRDSAADLRAMVTEASTLDSLVPAARRTRTKPGPA